MNDIISHFIASFLSISLAVVFYVHSLTLPPAAYQLPRLLSLVIVFLSILMLFGAFLEHKIEKKERKFTDNKSIIKKEKKEFFSINYKRVSVFILLISLYIFLIKPIGYFIVTPLFILITYLYLKSTRLINILLLSLGFTAFVYLVFVNFLKVPIPLGPLQ